MLFSERGTPIECRYTTSMRIEQEKAEQVGKRKKNGGGLQYTKRGGATPKEAESEPKRGGATLNRYA